MRELKFRQWLPLLGRYHFWGLGDINGDESSFTGPIVSATAVNEQFTGLRDVTGLDIYEGDIVFETGHGKNGVEWLHEVAAFGYRSKTGVRPIPLAWVCEVVGNIHRKATP